LYEHLKSIESQTGVTPEELIPPDFPVLLQPVWLIFIELSNSRQAGSMGGPSCITFEQMKAYTEITGEFISPQSASIIKKLDNKYLEVMNG